MKSVFNSIINLTLNRKACAMLYFSQEGAKLNFDSIRDTALILCSYATESS